MTCTDETKSCDCTTTTTCTSTNNTNNTCCNNTTKNNSDNNDTTLSSTNNNEGGGGCSSNEDSGVTHPTPKIRTTKKNDQSQTTTSTTTIERGSHMGRRGGAISSEKLISDLYRQFKLSLSHPDRCGLVTKGENILIGCSGGLRSLALLQCILNCNANEAKRTIHFKYHVVYLREHQNDQFVSDHDVLELENYVRELFANQGAFLGFSTASMEEFFPDYHSLMEGFTGAKGKNAENSELQDARRFLIKQALEMYAQKLGFSHVMIGTDATHLAITALANLAMGRPNIPLLMPFRFSLANASDAQSDNKTKVVFLQPMREILATEIAHYLYLQKVPVTKFGVFCASVDWKTKNSIQGVTESFIAYLQQNYPATVFTILRTGDKLKLRFDDAEQQETEPDCPVCRENIITAPYAQYGMCMGCVRLSEFHKENKQGFKRMAQRRDIEQFLLDDSL